MDDELDIPWELKFRIVELKPDLLKTLFLLDKDLYEYVNSEHGQNWISRTLLTIVDTPTEKGSMLGSMKHGVWKYYKNDKLIKTENFRYGLLRGESIEYYSIPRDFIKSKGTYIDGKKAGIWEYFNYRAVLVKTEKYNDNLIDIEVTEFEPENRARITRSYHCINGIINGDLIEYDSLGDIKNVIPYVNGKMNGTAIEYFKGTRVISNVREYKNGKLDGRHTRYALNRNKEAIIAEINIYKNGVIIENLQYRDNGDVFDMFRIHEGSTPIVVYDIDTNSISTRTVDVPLGIRSTFFNSGNLKKSLISDEHRNIFYEVTFYDDSTKRQIYQESICHADEYGIDLDNTVIITYSENGDRIYYVDYEG